MVHMGRRGLALELAVAVAVSVAAAVVMAVVLRALVHGYAIRDAVVVLAVALAALAGVGAREIVQRLRDSADRLRRRAAEYEEATGRAVEAERARIAAELHDVVTHHVSMIVVQAGAARTVLAAVPGGEPSGTADAIGALRAIEDGGRTAISELRTMLGLLSPEAGDDAGGRAGKASADRAPQPGLGDLDDLVARVSAAGLPVDLSVAGTPRPLPPGADLTAYRVVQESLTNVIRHGGKQTRTSVQLDWGTNLVITVSDAGHGPDREPSGWKAGRGLLGLRERLALYGGELAAGPRPGGGWQVRAELAP
jgi:signal transduction histidine kinase